MTTFSQAEYYNSHGKFPRGLGNWAFVPAKYADRPDYLHFVFWVNGRTFREAKAIAAQHFRDTKDCIVVCS